MHFFLFGECFFEKIDIVSEIDHNASMLNAAFYLCNRGKLVGTYLPTYLNVYETENFRGFDLSVFGCYRESV